MKANLPSIMVLCGAFAATGCGVTPDQEPPEQTAMAEEPLNEIGCATTSDAVLGKQPGTAVTSASGLYNPGPDCPSQFVVEFDTIAGHRYLAGGAWSNGGPAGCLASNDITQAVCSSALLSVGIYTHINGVWSPQNKPGYYARGTWETTQDCFGFSAPAHCDWTLQPGGYTNIPLVANADKIRVAVRGWTNNVGQVVTVTLTDDTI